MSKPKNSGSKINISLSSPKGVSITSPKGSLIAEINNLRKELKDYKQNKKDAAVKDTSGSVFVGGGVRSPQSSSLGMSKTYKERFFRASRDDGVFLSPTNDNQHNKSVTPKRDEQPRRDKSPHNLNNKSQSRQSKPYFQKTKAQNYHQEQQLLSQFSQSKSTKNQYNNKNNTQSQQLHLIEIMVKEKDRKLKLDIQLNKLRKIIIKQLGPVEIIQQINYLIQIINSVLNDYGNRIVILQKNQRIDQSDQSLFIKRQQHQIQELTQKLQSCQQQIKHLQQQLQQNKQSTQQTNQLAKRTTKNLTAFQSKTQQLQQSLKTLSENAIQLQEENKILSVKLLKKEQQLLLLDEDINYLRLQTEQHKQQKTELNELYDQTLTEYRDYKRTKTIELQKILSQKEKWEKQCKLRRSQNEAISALDEQKLALMKELTQMRMLVNLKSTQIQDKKALMHQNQKKVIFLQSELYKVKAELQTVKNQKDFAQFQNQKLKQEIEDVRKYGNRNYRSSNSNSGGPSSVLNNSYSIIQNKSQQKYSSSQLLTPKQRLVPTQQQFNNQTETYSHQTFSPHPNQEMKLHYNKKLKDKEEKLKALDDIHSLIKKHRHEMQI